jgi:hypothetical protein
MSLQLDHLSPLYLFADLLAAASLEWLVSGFGSVPRLSQMPIPPLDGRLGSAGLSEGQGAMNAGLGAKHLPWRVPWNNFWWLLAMKGFKGGASEQTAGTPWPHLGNMKEQEGGLSQSRLATGQVAQDGTDGGQRR